MGSEHEDPRAHVTVGADGVPVLHDPDALAMVEAVHRHNCLPVALDSLAAIRRFRARALEKGMAAGDTLIVVFNGDDPLGSIFAAQVMPAGWKDPYRAAGATPIARGLVDRAGMVGALSSVSVQTGRQLRAIAGVAVLVVDHGAPALFTYEEIDGADAAKDG